MSLILITVIILTLVWFAAINVHRGVRPVRIFSGLTTNPNRFLILLFPTPDVSELDRAVLVSLDEARRTTISVWMNDESFEFPREMFSASPSAKLLPMYINNLNKTLQYWGNDSDWANVEYKQTALGRMSRVQLKLVDHDGRDYIFTYTVLSDESINPLSIEVKD